jgi:head-tail adaptor
MTIGEKNRFITINKRSTTTDGANESTGWVLHKNKWAEAMGQTGMGRIRSEASAGGINTDLQRYSFRVNYDLSIDNTMQVVMKVLNPDGSFSYVSLDIQSVNHDHAGRSHSDLVCQTGGSNG